jgi:hypothetical protein
MATARTSKERHALSAGAAASGILALLVDARDARVKDDKDAAKTEVLLWKAGLTLEDIAAVTGKKYDAVRVSIQRSKVK